MIRWFVDWLVSLFAPRSVGVRTRQILPGSGIQGERMHSMCLALKPGSVREARLIAGWGGSPDPIDIPYVEAGAVSRIRLTTGEVKWVTSSPDDLRAVFSWPMSV